MAMMREPSGVVVMSIVPRPLALVGAENVYSFGQANVTDGPGLGIPNTFVFAFKGVGGTTVPNPVPEPASFLLLGSGLAGLAAWRRKKAA